MRLLLILFLMFIVACERADPFGVNTNVAESVARVTEFKTFGYDSQSYYIDSLPKSIKPDKPYQYWAYVGHNYPVRKKFVILKEDGDTLLRQGIDSLPASQGFFKRGQFKMRSDFIVVIENDSLKYISTDSGFREFLGTIDNVNEAVLLAETFHYRPDYESGGSDYRMVNGAYELNLVTFDPFPSCIPVIEQDVEKRVTVTRDGFIKAVSREKNNTSTKAE